MLESHLLRQPVSSIVLIKGFHCRALPGNTQTHKINYLNVFISMLVLELLHTCVQAGAERGLAASRPAWWPYRGPGARLRDERRGRPGESAGRGTGGAGLRRGRRTPRSGKEETQSVKRFYSWW